VGGLLLRAQLAPAPLDVRREGLHVPHTDMVTGTLSDEDGITVTPSPSGSATVTGVMVTTS